MRYYIERLQYVVYFVWQTLLKGLPFGYYIVEDAKSGKIDARYSGTTAGSAVRAFRSAAEHHEGAENALKEAKEILNDTL